MPVKSFGGPAPLAAATPCRAQASRPSAGRSTSTGSLWTRPSSAPAGAQLLVRHEPSSPGSQAEVQALCDKVESSGAGLRVASRQQQRLKQALERRWQGERQVELGSHPWEGWPKKEPALADVALEAPKDASGKRPAAVQAKSQGSAVILWHRSEPESGADAARLRERRRRSTEKMLFDISSHFAIKKHVVQWWFRIFEFYCVRPADRWPSLAQLPLQEAGPESDEQAIKRLARSASRSPCARCLEDRSPVHQVRASSDANVRLRKLKLRHRTRAPPQRTRSEWTAGQWNHQRDLCRSEIRDIRKQRGDLNLLKRTQTESLDAEKLQDWLAHYEVFELNRQGLDPTLAVSKLAPAGGPGKKRSTESIRQSVISAIEVQAALKAAEAPQGPAQPAAFQHMLKDAFGGMFSRTTSEVVNGPMMELAPEAAEEDTPQPCIERAVAMRPRTAEAVEAQQPEHSGQRVMLNASSYALLTCSLLNKKVVKRAENPDRQEDLRRACAKTLRLTVPVDMTFDNFAHAMSILGVRVEQAISMTWELLQSGVPLLATANMEATASSACLVFERFFALARALYPHLEVLENKRAKELHAGQSADWAESSLLRRLVYYLLTGHKGARAEEGAGAELAADSVGAPLALDRVEEGVGLLVGRPDAPDGNEGLSEEALAKLLARRRRFDTRTRQLAEVLHGSLHVAEQEVHSVQEAHLQRQRLPPRQRPGSASSYSTVISSDQPTLAERQTSAGSRSVAGVARTYVVSFLGFQRFVAKQPEVFRLLVRMLMPLALKGPQLMGEQMEVAAKCLPHRASEMRQRVQREAQQTQLQLLEELHKMFTLQHQHFLRRSPNMK